MEHDQKKSFVQNTTNRLILNTLMCKSLLGRALGTLSIIRFKSFDTSTIEGRSNERLRRVFWTAAASALAKGVNTLTMLAYVPIALSYLGTERYGLWMAITSTLGFLGFADLGIGNGVLNLISESHGKGDVEVAKKSISSAFFLLIGISVGFAFLFVLVYPHVAWDRFFNVSSSMARTEAGPAVATLVACVLANLALSIIPRIQMGYQEGYLNSIWQGFASLLGLVGLVAIVRLEAGLPWLVLVIAGAPVIENLLNGVGLFAFQRARLLPKWRYIDRSFSWQILSIGFLFLVLQVANAVIYYADNIIIARTLGPEVVTHYAVPSRLFWIVSNSLYMVLAPLWPAYGEASARGDNLWVRTTLIKTVLLILVLCSLASSFLIVFGERILEVWTGSRVVFSLSLMIGLGVWATLSSVITSIAMFLNAMEKIFFQSVFSFVVAVLSVAVKISIVRSFGLLGIVWSNIICSLILMLIPYIIYSIITFNKYKKPTKPKDHRNIE